MGKITKIEGTGVYEGYVTWQGWDPHEDFLGPFYHKRVGNEIRCAFLAEEKHVNGGGGLHGGLLLSFADHSIFVIAQDCLGEDAGGVTVSLHGEFCAGGQKGDFVEAVGDVVRETRSLVFVRGMIVVGDKTLVNFSAIIKK